MDTHGLRRLYCAASADFLGMKRDQPLTVAPLNVAIITTQYSGNPSLGLAAKSVADGCLRHACRL